MSTQISGSQIVITGGNFQQSNQGSKDPFERLLEAASPAAFHDSDHVHDPPKCHPNTRIAVLDKIMDWVHGADPQTRDALIMWLYGPAGSGKSAIGRSTAELCAKEGILVASYFFSRFDSTRNHGRSLIATIAYQVSLCFPDTRNRIAGAIGRDPLIFSRSLNSQISSLIIGPLQERIDAGYFNGPKSARIIIIDGLDECDDRDIQVKILDAISQALKRDHVPFIFLVASRPEPDIRNAFCLGYLSQISTRNPLDDGYRPSEDIRLFLLDTFAEIKESHPFRAQIPPVWPPENALQTLVNKSSGQFIYASTVVKFIKSTRHRPPQRLETILGLRPAQHEMPFAELDALYMQIFLSVVNPEAALQILALYFLTEFASCITASGMEEILSLEAGQIPVLFCDLTSLIFIREDPETSILGFFHASLADFLFDQSRSKQFWINEPLRHAEFAVLYLKDIQDSRWCRFFRSHCRCAAPTMELQEAITKPLVVRQLFKQKLYDFIPEFFAMISQLDIGGTAQLYNTQIQHFDHFAKEVLNGMYPHSRVTALVSTIKMKIKPYHFHAYDLFMTSRAQISLDKLSFRFAVLTKPDYRRFISEFLEDPRRSGTYALTSKRYAISAVYFIKCISDYLKQITPSDSAMERKFEQQRNTPWRWRKMVQNTHSSEAAQLQSLRNQYRMNLEWGSFPISNCALGMALRCLAHVLPQSARSNKLTTLVRGLTFGSDESLVRKWPNRTRAVKREISQYLARVEQEGH